MNASSMKISQIAEEKFEVAIVDRTLGLHIEVTSQIHLVSSLLKEQFSLKFTQRTIKPIHRNNN